jgi:hypothetical protein
MRIKLIGMTLCLLMASVFVSCDEPRVEQQQQREPQGIAKLASVDEQNPMIGSYIVVLKHNAKSPPGLEHAMGPYRAMKDMTITDSFEMIRGFAAKIPEARLRHLKEDPNVEFIEPVQIASICSTASYQTLDWGVSYVGGDSSSTKSNDHGGAVTTNGVEVYVVDTGIDPTHPDLNVGGGANFAMVNYVIDSTAWQDEHSHGTHVAGIIGAKDNYAWTVGMAPGVKLFSVRVFDATGSGSSTGILRGLSWVLSQKLARPTVPMVVNMSLICGPSLGLDRAVQTLIEIPESLWWSLLGTRQRSPATTAHHAHLWRSQWPLRRLRARWRRFPTMGRVLTSSRPEQASCRPVRAVAPCSRVGPRWHAPMSPEPLRCSSAK